MNADSIVSSGVKLGLDLIHNNFLVQQYFHMLDDSHILRHDQEMMWGTLLKIGLLVWNFSHLACEFLCCKLDKPVKI